MREIGSIKLVQIQRSPLKRGEKPHRYYDPSEILTMSSLLLTGKGVIGVISDDEHLLDVHHADHPRSHHQGDNGISIGFTSHYRSMRARFGEHLLDGYAGENILVETEEEQTLSDLEGGVTIEIAATGQLVPLKDIMVAAPCVEFSRFSLKEDNEPSAEQLKKALQFLNHGKRGFYATLADSASFIEIQAGDRLLTSA
ncbi:hypothetical protein EPA93_42660 [Ktedonosporobacter rubrisoli]|uniref:MOSC domain-containing protein n=1 Tax=Ktedonosporobacter rubrisoli TaxID=2509675 RepID=A0A4P6K483_KTERU|nr:hypothetical protein [Ktedonosporobacter rubrisoli]QBD82326.1 hypothetical protein EPA93_42660 [Ktedonosporobacter rubrisoli]